MLGISVEAMRGSGATATQSESNVDEEQVPNKVTGKVPSLFSSACHGVYSFGRALASTSMVDGKAGYVR